MTKKFNSFLPAALSVAIMLSVVACGNATNTTDGVDGSKSGVGSENTTVVPSGKTPNASVSGTVDYNERLALSEGASLVVDLRDVTYADGPAPLIARKIISDPGQVPIQFDLGYNRQDINSKNTYAINARIVESDGRLAFTNDTAYDVITGGRSKNIDMLLSLVEPPSEQFHDSTADWRSWIEVPAQITGAGLIPGEREPTLRVRYLQSSMENCALRGTEDFRVEGNDIIVTVTLKEHPEAPWSAPCDDELVELDTIKALGSELEIGETYNVIVNGELITSFTHQ